LKLRRVTIENYKALGHVDIRMPGDLLFLIGVNGAGKSSILQALSLVRYFADGSTTGFFKDRGWKPTDARPKTTRVAPLRAATSVNQARRIPGRNFGISLALEHEGHSLLWSFQWDYQRERALEEAVWILDPNAQRPRRVLAVPASSDDATQLSEMLKVVRLDLPGSVLSIVQPQGIAASARDASLLAALKAWAEGITSLELLNPAAMRNRFRDKGSDIGPQGERLPTFLADLPSDAKERIVQRIADFYPIHDLNTTRKRSGWIDMRVAEAFKLMGRVGVDHMSDGFLRILALCAIPEFGEEASLVLLDEVEDGIEPHILPRLIDRVAADATAQLVMTSHSPLLINFFDQDQTYLFGRDRSGQTVGSGVAALAPFRQGGDYLGSGEIWANVGLTALDDALPRFRPPRRGIADDPSPREVLQYLRD
jgi:predicted ATPase